MGSTDKPLSSQSQLLSQTQAFTSNASGQATVKFPSPPQGYTWTGTLNCATADTGAVFLASVGAVSWGEWGGNSVYGPVQVLGTGSQQLVITASGLAPSSNYTLQWNGSSDPSNFVAAVWPDANSTALTAEISGTVPITGTVDVSSVATPVTIIPIQHVVMNTGIGPIGSTGTTTSTTTLTLLETDQSLSIQLQSLTGGFATNSYVQVQVVGVTSGNVYLQQNITTYGPLLNLTCPVFGFVENVKIVFTCSSSGITSFAISTVLIIGSSEAFTPVPLQITNQLTPALGTIPLQVNQQQAAPLSGYGTSTFPATPGCALTANSSINMIVVTFTNPVAGTTYTASTYTGTGIASAWTNGVLSVSKTATLSGTSNPLQLLLPITIAPQAISTTVDPVSLTTSTPSTSTDYTIAGFAITNITNVAQNPGLPFDQVTYGGLQIAFTNAVTTTSPGVSLLSAPASGFAYRLHSWAVNTLPTAGSVRLWGGSGAAGTFGAVFTSGAQGTQYLGGILTTSAVYVYGPSLTPSTVGACLFYDIVQLPSII